MMESPQLFIVLLQFFDDLIAVPVYFQTKLQFACHLVQNVFEGDRKSTRLNSSHSQISYAVFCLKKKILSFDSTKQISVRLPAELFTTIASVLGSGESAVMAKRIFGTRETMPTNTLNLAQLTSAA